MNKRKILAAILLLAGGVAAADFRETFIDSHDGMLDASQYLSQQKLGFLPVPMIITEPAVGFGLGMFGIFFHESAEQRKQRIDAGGSLLPENISVVGGAATENGTWFAGGGHLGFWKGDTVRYSGFAGYASINADFYSLGGVTLPQPIQLEIEGPGMLNEIKWRLGETSWFVGARQLFTRVESALRRPSEGGLLPPPGIFPPLDDFLTENLNQDVTTSGLGAVLEFDSRNNPFNPESGYKYTVQFMRFDDAIGSDIDYSSLTAKGLNYWTLAEKWVVGLRIQFDQVAASDDARLPAYVPPFINLRGVPAARYQGNNVAVSELQVDYKLGLRWKLSAFAGVGRAAQEFSDLSDATSIVNKGVGFRYLIARRYGFVMGIDYARGPEDNAFYIQAGSAW